MKTRILTIILLSFAILLPASTCLMAKKVQAAITKRPLTPPTPPVLDPPDMIRSPIIIQPSVFPTPVAE